MAGGRRANRRNMRRNSPKASPKPSMTGRIDDPDFNGSSTERNVEARMRGAAASAARGRSRRDMSLDTFHAIEAAQDGDDFALLPYRPTPSINPPRPRTLAAGYDSDTKTLRVRFRDNTPWEYYDVPPNVWRSFRRTASPGRFINRVLNQYSYSKGDF